MTFILASSSPRRQQILETAGYHVLIQSADINESLLKGEAAEAAVLRLAVEKAAAVAAQHPDTLVLAADTLITCDGRILGKPKNAKVALENLQMLRGRTHEVCTGFASCQGERTWQEVQTTKVTLDEVPDSWLEAYVNTREPLDKAGCYGIQGADSAD